MDITNKIIAGISDNATNMTAALQQFNYQHINCYAHTLQLAINEGLKECHEIINKAKIFNNTLVCRDKYRETLRHEVSYVQNEMQIYATMLQIPTHPLNDPLYLTENPLILWKLHHKALPIHAKQA
ncbi:4602_t:CDS:2, partial [Ambispora gerdemannii]